MAGMIGLAADDAAAPAMARPPENDPDSAQDGAMSYRAALGPDWDAAGQSQLDYLIAAGLAPHHRVLDIGCGALRAGARIVRYLDEQLYYGIDRDKPLLNLGHRHELAPDGLQEKCPRRNLYCSELFRHERLAPGSIDVGLCISVIRELPLNYVRICLENAAPYFRPGAALHMSFFELAAAKAFAQPYTNMARARSFGFKPPYHYYRRDLENAALGTAWRVTYIGGWGHREGESMMVFTKR